MGITKTQIKKWNTHFNSLTKAQKRVEIAKDVIKQIKLGKYSPTRGAGYVNSYINKNLDVQSNFDKLEACECCMLGTCILSLTKFENKLTFSDVINGFGYENSKVSKMLKKVFTPYQQALLEACFEYGGYTHAGCAYDAELSEQEEDKCKRFYSKYPSPKARVIAAMKNIIANNGSFRP